MRHAGREILCAVEVIIRQVWNNVHWRSAIDRLHFSSKEKLYAHYISQASWAGARIIQGQWTPQAERLYDLLIFTFSDQGKLGDLEGLKQKSCISEEDWDSLMQYTIQVRITCFFLCVQSQLLSSGPKQPCQLQVFWFHQIYPPCI